MGSNPGGNELVTKKVVKSIPDLSGMRRVDIIEREDGTFGFVELYFSEHPDEQSWIPTHHQMTTFSDTAAAAEREPRARVDWLIEG